jgi:hypothetical protein
MRGVAPFCPTVWLIERGPISVTAPRGPERTPREDRPLAVDVELDFADDALHLRIGDNGPACLLTGLSIRPGTASSAWRNGPPRSVES